MKKKRSIDLPLLESAWSLCRGHANWINIIFLTQTLTGSKYQNIQKRKFSTNRVINHSRNHSEIFQKYNKALLCIVPIFLYVTPKGTMNRGKQEGSCARFCILFRSWVLIQCGFRTTIFSDVTCYSCLRETDNVASNLLVKANLTIYATTREKKADQNG